MTLPNIYTVNEVLKYLKISRPNLYSLIKSRKIKPFKQGKKTMFAEEELARYVDKLKAETK
ncbi:MAG TPA: helix-turn-helix domain-containing protein [Syntrophorhabdaceae bacterium]|nr:helix-turn-helix domain-containing protein [Syntrophorhabdaceae bacterium]